ncbi:chaplin family protein [Streptomyces sp. NPDC048197]|uniref:chaplin n=1 Tax=Streptomyces sp. NPDC048197 TaxID=3365511 RepID=UPI00371032CD
MHFHDLRHRGNTPAATGGATTPELMHRVGDSSARTALIYQHLINGHDQAIADHAEGQVNEHADDHVDEHSTPRIKPLVGALRDISVSRALIRPQPYLMGGERDLTSYVEGLESMSYIAKALVATVAAGVAVTGMAGVASANSEGQGQAVGSPGIISGNVVQVPITVPINLCGNTLNFIGVLNPAVGNTCINADIRSDHHQFHHHAESDRR